MQDHEIILHGGQSFAHGDQLISNHSFYVLMNLQFILFFAIPRNLISTIYWKLNSENEKLISGLQLMTIKRNQKATFVGFTLLKPHMSRLINSVLENTYELRLSMSIKN